MSDNATVKPVQLLCAHIDAGGRVCGAAYNELRGDHVQSFGHQFVASPDWDGQRDARLTISILMEKGRPILAATFAKHMKAQVDLLRSIDKNMHGRITTDWYLAGFDMQMEGVAYQLVGATVGSVVMMTAVHQDAPNLVTPVAVETGP